MRSLKIVDTRKLENYLAKQGLCSLTAAILMKSTILAVFDFFNQKFGF